MGVGAAELWGGSGTGSAGAQAPGGFRVPRLPERASRRSPRCSCSGDASARTGSRSCSLAFIVFLVVVALAAPLIVKLLGLPGPNVQNPNLTDSFGSPLGPSLAHPFGVDQLGQDVMSRVIYGTRVALEVGILGTAVATVIGVVIGTLAGFYRGWVDTLLSRLIDVVLSIPILLLGLGIGAACAVRGCVGGTVQPGLGPGDLPDRAGELDVHRADRARARAEPARERVRAGLARARRLEHADHVPRDLPEPARADHRLLDAVDPAQHPARGGPVVSSASASARRPRAGVR